MSDNSNELEKLRRIIRRLDEKLRSLTEELKVQQSKLSESKEQNNESTKLADSLSDELERRTVEVHSLSVENDDFKSQLKALSDEHLSLTKKYTEVKNQLIAQDEILENDKLDSTPEQMMKRNRLLELTLVRLREESLDNELRLTERINSLSDSVNEMDDIKNKYAVCQKRGNDLEKLSKELQTRLSSLQGSEELIEDLTLKNEGLTSKNEELSKNISELEDLETLNQELIDNHSLIEEELKQEIESLKRKLDDREGKIHELDLKIQKLEQIILRKTAEGEQEPKPVVENTNDANERSEFQNSLAEAYELGSKKYSDFLSSIFVDADAPKLNLFRDLISVSTIASFFSDRFLERARTDVEQGEYLVFCQVLMELTVIANFLLEVGRYRTTVIPEDIEKQIHAYLQEFSQRYEINDFEIPLSVDLVVADPSLKARESAILEFSKLDSKVRLGIFILGRSDLHSDYVPGLVKIHDILSDIIDKLMQTRASGDGLVEAVHIDEISWKKLDLFLSNLIDSGIQDGDLVIDTEAVSTLYSSLNEFSSLKVQEIPILQVFQGEEKQERVTVVHPADRSDAKLVEELKLKISVLQARLDKLQINEGKLMEADSSLKNEKRENEQLTERLSGLREQKLDLESKLAKTNEVLVSVGLDQYDSEEWKSKSEVHKEFERTDRNRMINEISKQRDFIERLTGARAGNSAHEDYSWLEANLAAPIKTDPVQPLKETVDRLFDLNINFGIMPQDKMSDPKFSRYYIGLIEEGIIDHLTSSY
ncbi:DEKNAAC104959 [Brettanomyces naardenensis]|uniref:DEKNAAC104959 n=1 Tax=Brettanomyces naardenensis TaxID=13370 RepID=A0A448YSK1_BRENA|nr:DEKNAAC104959 [Brettanomyces naardenensis]